MQKYLTNSLKWCKVYKHYIFTLYQKFQQEIFGKDKEMEEKIKMSILCSIYGKLLTEKQYEILNDYYNNDFSLSEIAENNEITRQAVKDVINKSNDKLLEYENKLSFMDKMLKQKACVKEIKDDLNKLQNKELTDQKIQNLSNKLDQLIDD